MSDVFAHQVDVVGGARFAEIVTPESAQPAARLSGRTQSDVHPVLHQPVRDDEDPFVSAQILKSSIVLLSEFVVAVSLGVFSGIAYNEFVYGNLGNIGSQAVQSVVVGTFFCATLQLLMSRSTAVASTWWERLCLAGEAWLVALALLTFAFFVSRANESVSRGGILTFFILGLAAMPACHVLIPRRIARSRNGGRLSRRPAILIASNANFGILDTLNELSRAGYDPVVLTFDPPINSRIWPKECQVLLARVFAVARELGPGEVFIMSGAVSVDCVLGIQAGLGKLPRAVHIIPDQSVTPLFKSPATSFGNTVSVEVQKEPQGTLGRTTKRAIDVIGACALLIMLAPAFLIIALGVKLDSRGPVIFSQIRNGLGGRKFRIFKFRTMHVLEDGPEVVQAKANDTRVTPFGAWLRRSSMDELPQLVNVLFGQMSLVGPRPHAVTHDELFSKRIDHYEVRQHVKPGITGWAQVNGLRGETETMDKMYRRIEHDLWYARNSGLLLDIQILIRTVGEVFRQTNAY